MTADCCQKNPKNYENRLITVDKVTAVIQPSIHPSIHLYLPKNFNMTNVNDIEVELIKM